MEWPSLPTASATCTASRLPRSAPRGRGTAREAGRSEGLPEGRRSGQDRATDAGQKGTSDHVEAEAQGLHRWRQLQAEGIASCYKVLLAESGTDTVDDLGTGSPNLSKNCSAKYAASSLFRSPSPVDKPVFEAVVSLVRRPTRRAMGWPSLPTASATCTASPSRQWWGDLWLGPDGGHEGYNSIAEVVAGRRLDRRPQPAHATR